MHARNRLYHCYIVVLAGVTVALCDTASTTIASVTSSGIDVLTSALSGIAASLLTLLGVWLKKRLGK